jgi:lipopolysaccharide transport system permease protein
VKFGVQLLLLFAMMLFYGLKGGHFQITWYMLLFPVLVLLLACLGLGLGMVVSAMTTKYRDLAFLVTFGVPLLMYATTVVFPLSAAPERFHNLIN